MNKLTVIYDSSCPFCVHCRWWLFKQRQFVELDFYPSGSEEIELDFPGFVGERGR